MANPLIDRPRAAAAWFRALAPAERLRPALAAMALVSGGLIAGALFFQYATGIEPCKLCLVQRGPHYAILGLSAAGLALGAVLPAGRMLADLRAGLLFLAGAAFLYTGGYGVYHTGAERGWWPGPADCTGSALPDSMAAFTALLAEGEQFVRCDEVPWSFLGLSMASYNALISFPTAVFVLTVAALYLKTRIAARHHAEQHG